MEKLNEKKKHNHKLTTWLKASIFSIVMLAPFLSVLSRVIYVQANPNANLSYSGNTTTEYSLTLVQNENQLIFGNDYQISLIEDYAFTNDNYKRIYVNSTTFISAIGGLSQSQLDAVLNCDSFTSTYYNSISYLVFYDNQNTQLAVVSSSYKLTFKFNLRSYVIPNTITSFANAWDSIIYKYDYLHNYFLDNAFEYGIQKLHESQIYNWAKNTGIYTAIDNMTTGLEMGTNNTLALLLAYWSIITAIYIVFDIVIVLFTKITHMINE